MRISDWSSDVCSSDLNARAGLASVVDPSDIIIPYGADSDKIINYEVGLKGSWLNGKLTANLAAYLIDWTDIQVQANRVSDSVQFATNIGGARSRGFEFEITAVPTSGLTIGINEIGRATCRERVCQYV